MKGAIMLTAPWGTGKSYYIENTLKPYIESDDNRIAVERGGKGKKTKEKLRNRKCIIVSLYDISSTVELSKALYFEKKLPAFMKTKKATRFFAAAKTIGAGLYGVGKTVLRNLTSIDINLETKDFNLEKLHNHVDFKGDLIVLEDLERSRTNIIDILGYVNNLVEHDGAKVLLVANEEEIVPLLKKQKGSEKESQDTQYSEEQKKYLKVKEKTISDTISYVGAPKEAVKNILESFDNPIYNNFLNQVNEYEEIKIVSEILNIMHTLKCNNFRSVIFGCQKTVDMYKYVDESSNMQFLQYLLCSNIAFALKLKKNENIEWDEMGEFSSGLGTYTFPLPRVCYDYIKNQIIPTGLKQLSETYTKQKTEEAAQKEIREHLGVLYSYFSTPEKEVKKELIYVRDKVERNEGISYKEYTKLANYLVAIHHIIGCDDEINRCRKAMIDNLKEAKPVDLTEDTFFGGGIQLNTKEEVEEFQKWKNEIDGVIRQKRMEGDSFDCFDEVNILTYYDYVRSHEHDIYAKRQFAKRFDVEKFVDSLMKAPPSQIVTIRSMFQYVYMPANIKEFLIDDKNALCEIKTKLDENVSNPNVDMDKISRHQLCWFLNELQEYIDKMK